MLLCMMSYIAALHMQVTAITVMYCALVLVMKDLNCYSNPMIQVSYPYPPFLDKESECGHSHASISLSAAVGQPYFIVTCITGK